MIADTIRYLLSNFTLTFLVLGAVTSAMAIARTPRPLTARQGVSASSASSGADTVGM